MRVETAIKTIDAEAAFLGLHFDTCMAEIELLGSKLFSEPVLLAHRTLLDAGYVLGNTVVVR